MDREYEPPPPEMLEWVGRHVHTRARVTAVVRLLGGITADMDRITLDSPQGVKDLVLRRWPDQDWTRGLVERRASCVRRP